METGKCFQLQPAQGVDSQFSEKIQDFMKNVENETADGNEKIPVTTTVFSNELVSFL